MIGRRSYAGLILMSLCASPMLQSQNPSQSAPRKVSAAPPASEQAGSSDSLPREVADAEAAIIKSDWTTAKTRLDAWLRTHPNDPRALFDAGYVDDAQNRLDDAASLYLRATQADPKSFEAHLSLGLVLARQGKVDEARSELAASTQLDPGEAGTALKARAWRALAQIDKASNATEASDDLLEALKLSPETSADTLLAASLAEASGQPEAAEAAYRRVLAKDPKSIQSSAGLAHLLIAQKKYADAESLLRTALGQSPDDPSLTAQLAAALAAQDKAEALPLLDKLHGQHPEDQSITRMLADMKAQAGDAAGSDALYAQLLAIHPNEVDLLVAHGENLTRQLRYPEAFSVFNKAAQIDPANGEAWSGLAFVASKTGQPEAALHALTMRSKYLPEVPSTYFLWATSYDTLHEKVQAIAYYHQFLDASGGKFPDQEWQARQRLHLLERKN